MAVQLWVRSLGSRVLKNLVEADDISNTAFVDSTSDAVFLLTNADIHDNGTPVQLVDDTLDAGWSRTNNVVTYSGAPEKVTGYVAINAGDSGASSYWSRPKLRVLRGSTVVAIIDDLVMQDTAAYDGSATINGVFVDKNPPPQPDYTFEWFDNEQRAATLPPNPESSITLVATNKIEVITV